ncbi:MAG: hypothetical protein AB1426_10620 [Bacillota bacterium]
MAMVTVLAAGLFVKGMTSIVVQIVGGSSRSFAVDFAVLFLGGALYAAGLLFIWYYSALALTNNWLSRLIKRLEAETRMPTNN